MDHSAPLWLDSPFWGKWVAFILLFSMFLIPVMAAYVFADRISPLAENCIVHPSQSLSASAPFLKNILVGNYGLVSLGLYSFIWAFPVVFLYYWMLYSLSG